MSQGATEEKEHRMPTGTGPVANPALPRSAGGFPVRRTLSIAAVARQFGLTGHAGDVWGARYGIGVSSPPTTDDGPANPTPCPEPDTWFDNRPAWTWPDRAEEWALWMATRSGQGGPGQPRPAERVPGGRR
jgi:hypothetical protein